MDFLTGNIDSLVGSIMSKISDSMTFRKIQDKIKDYLLSQAEKFYAINSFLIRSKKIPFFQIYYPLTITSDEYRTKFSKPEKEFEKNKYIAITGIAGTGKSTLLKYIFINSIEDGYKIPIYIELRIFNSLNYTLEEFIYQTINIDQNDKPQIEVITSELRKGIFLFLLDGFDEISSDKIQNFRFQLELFIDKYNQNDFVITSRPGLFIEMLPRFTHFKLNSLSKEETLHFVTRFSRLIEVDYPIESWIEGEYKNFPSLLSNPLLISLFILTYKSYSTIPRSKAAFFSLIFDTLYAQHDLISNRFFPREKFASLEREQYLEILYAFSFLSFFGTSPVFSDSYLLDSLKKVKESLVSFSFKPEDVMKDFQITFSIILKEGLENRFIHRGLQEYFAAMYVASVSDERKEKFFKNLAEKNEKYFFDINSDFSFFNIFQEIDQQSFLKFVVLNGVNYILDSVSNLEGIIPKIAKFFDLQLVKPQNALFNERNIVFSPPYYWWILQQAANVYHKSYFSELGNYHIRIEDFQADNYVVSLSELLAQKTITNDMSLYNYLLAEYINIRDTLERSVHKIQSRIKNENNSDDILDMIL